MIGWEDIGKRRFEEGEWTGVGAFLLAGRIWMGHGPMDSPWWEPSNEPKNMLIGEGWDMGESVWIENWIIYCLKFNSQFKHFGHGSQILNPIIGLRLCQSTSQFYLFHHANQIISLPQSNQFGCHSQNWLHPPTFPHISTFTNQHILGLVGKLSSRAIQWSMSHPNAPTQ